MEGLLSTFGPWALYLVIMIGVLRFMVTDKLKTIMTKLDMVDRHETDIKLIQQLMDFNGCNSPYPSCRIRKEDQ